MRAIHINPWNKTVREIDLDDDGDCITYDALRKAVFHGREHALGYIDRVDLGSNVDAWIDEEGTQIPWDEQRFLALHPPGRPQDGITMAGHVVLTAHDGWGGSIGLPKNILLELVQATVQWLDAREVAMPAPKIFTIDPKTGEKTLIHDEGTWTYDNQPD
jgi:hypothetical protein